MNAATDLEPGFRIPEAAVADIVLLARHRAGRFRDMGRLEADWEASLVRATADYLRDALPRGEYLGWVADSVSSSPEPVGGAGVQLRSILPRPRPTGEESSSARRPSSSTCMSSRRGGGRVWVRH